MADVNTTETGNVDGTPAAVSFPVSFLQSDTISLVIPPPPVPRSVAYKTKLRDPKDSSPEKETVFKIHKTLLASVSKTMEKHVNNDMREGKENIFVLFDVDLKTAELFVEWVYTKKYRIQEPEGSSAQLLPHAKLYVLGDRFDIIPLQDYAYQRITKLLSILSRDESGVPLTKTSDLSATDTAAIIKMIKYAFQNLPTAGLFTHNGKRTRGSRTIIGKLLQNGNRLLVYLAHYAAWALKFLRGHESFAEIERLPDFAAAMLRAPIRSSVTPPAPHVDREIEAQSLGVL